MSLFKRLFFLMSALAATVFVVSAVNAAAPKDYVTIGTGGVTGVYYPTGGAICRLVNKGRREHNIRCNIESTGGSIYNINTIRAGEMDMGFTQSDWLYHGYKGTSVFKSQGPNPNLRAVFAMHSEPLTIVARQDANIKTFEDLKGKRVNIGNPGSGQRANMEQLINVYGWTKKDFKLLTALKSSEQAQALCDNKIDVFAFVAGHPSGSIKEATTSCKTNLVAIKGPKVTALINKYPFMKAVTIPGGMYKGTPEDIETYGVSAVLMTSTDVSEDIVYNVVKSVFHGFDDFRRLHQTLRTLTKEDMVDVKGVPFHKGALRYFKEVNLK